MKEGPRALSETEVSHYPNKGVVVGILHTFLALEDSLEIFIKRP